MKIRDNGFRIELKEGAIRDYEKVILSDINDIFMPMGFVSHDEGEVVSYNCSGYASLAQCGITEVIDALEILERTFHLISRASEYLISPNMITLSMDTIFYDKDSNTVRIAYVPVDRENAVLRENIADFIAELSSNVNEESRTYLNEVKNQMEENNYYIQDLINVIGDIRRTVIRNDEGETVTT